jgi:hypothetical protein
MAFVPFISQKTNSPRTQVGIGRLRMAGEGEKSYWRRMGFQNGHIVGGLKVAI